MNELSARNLFALLCALAAIAIAAGATLEIARFRRARRLETPPFSGDVSPKKTSANAPEEAASTGAAQNAVVSPRQFQLRLLASLLWIFVLGILAYSVTAWWPQKGDLDQARRFAAAIGAGLCGCTIEDTTADPAAPVHGFDAAVARVAAAVRAARAASHPFVLTARAENFLHGRPDLEDTVRRLVAFAEAGADCLYAPGLPSLEAIRTVVAAVAPKPVNVLAGPRDGLVSQQVLAAAGVRRISVGGVLARAAYGQVLAAGRSLLGGDLPSALKDVPSHADIEAMMEPAS